ncbi:EcsC family protein [Hymenobacter sp. UV11]|uniref:EcsC family protein n=1 Tax=Hymenobacter sp. UV11 TaxID=1849735 RepID=UPI00105F2563|nr:EcsC family protein [Hymenobacter sp. UV11]TDN38511.1 ABC transporter-associated protein EcsC [Hymenobacter sp. UV11]TFZ65290.1 EcsC family protein [Hymenobacter sp. UV11]
MSIPTTPAEQVAYAELQAWQQQMQRLPTRLDKFTRRVQLRLNDLLPERLHQAVTATIKQLVRGVLFGSTHTTRRPLEAPTLAAREAAVRDHLRDYRLLATAEGAVTGAGGFLLGLADFPLLLGLKLKLLFDVAACYGYDVRDYSERLYLLHIFQLAFSSQHTRNETYYRLAHWEEYRQTLPAEAADFDWRTFQQEYRDYIDLAKMAQLVPVIGAAVGAVANYRLLQQLGTTAMNCYRLRYFAAPPQVALPPDEQPELTA